jgi:hypothetical protein
MDSAIIVAMISGGVSLVTVVFSSIMGIIGTKRTKERQAEIEQRQAEIEKFKEWDNLRQNVAIGVQCLLRIELIRSHEKYTAKEHCPVYAKENLTRAYKAYHALGGNDVATELYNQLMQLPNDIEEL